MKIGRRLKRAFINIWKVILLVVIVGCNTAPVKVANPDYLAWAAFAPGSTVTFEGIQKTGA